MAGYTLTITLPDAPTDVEPRVREALQNQGFGVLSEIDVQATLADKIGHQMGAYRILGACNPQLAKRAIAADPDIGALLPCNVLIRGNSAGGTDVVVVDPMAMLALGSPELASVAEEARAGLESALTELGE